MSMHTTRIILHRGEDRRIREGHPWVFSNEIREVAGDDTPGVTAELFDAGGKFLGTGYYNRNSLIAFRVLSREREPIDSVEFFERRILRALSFREKIYPGLQTFRAVYGESDFLPGLVVDRYGDYLSLQVLTAGMEMRRGLVLEALRRVFSPKGVLARNDVGVRRLEGLPEVVEVLWGEVPDTVEMEEHGLRFLVDLAGGQKTGHFLDQKENHLLLRGICDGGEVLDCFCYSGSWALHAASFGASAVTGVDISERAVSLARKNAALNAMGERVVFEKADAFDRLRTLRSEGRRFDVVVLDPPAFVKSRKQIREALSGYLTINTRGMQLLKPGGTLITCSCSHHISIESFRNMLVSAARQAGRRMWLSEVRSQAPDHPVLLQAPETEYLKCFVLKAL
ncbi:MAG TPA: class I SAM-dependent rRNA methyltransferase [Verrucomicrobiae bacterium]|nr:class I SAM-dependent rRNA methyltransferase [Verrucomicrobiae bacterium]